MTKGRDEYLIWSFEHDAWWGPDQRGYVKDHTKAGRYPRLVAEDICAGANFRPDVLNETFVPAYAFSRQDPIPAIYLDGEVLERDTYAIRQLSGGRLEVTLDDCRRGLVRLEGDIMEGRLVLDLVP